MAKKRKVKSSRLALVIVAGLVISLLVVAGIYGVSRLVVNLFDDNQTNNEPNNNVVIEEDDDEDIDNSINISLEDYKVYEDDTDKLGFNFIVAEMTFKGESSISFDLNKLQTSEKINLKDVSKYITKLNEQGYNISKLNIATDIKSNENKYTCYVFIPYTTDSLSLGLYNLTDASRIDFDVSKNVNYITSLKIEEDNEIVIDETSISVSGSYQSDVMLHNDSQYPLAGNIKVYVFSLSVNSIDTNTNVIESAKFVPDSSSTTYEALDSGYRDLSIDNIIDKPLKVGDKYALFFEVYSSDDISYDGKLIIKFKNNDKLVELSTTL